MKYISKILDNLVTYSRQAIAIIINIARTRISIIKEDLLIK